VANDNFIELIKVLVGQPLSGVGVNLAACEQLGMDGGG